MNRILQYSGAAYLMLIMLVKMMSMPIALLDYSLNKNFISANLCENRFAPEARCEGKCFLNKQLGKTGEVPGSTEHKTSGKEVVVDYFETARSGSLSLWIKKAARLLSLSLGKISLAFLPAVFRPPLFAFA